MSYVIAAPDILAATLAVSVAVLPTARPMAALARPANNDDISWRRRTNSTLIGL
jgi:hypothetical protein